MDPISDNHKPYPYMELIENVYANGEDGPSRMGDIRQLTNQVMQIEDVSKICKMPYNVMRKENQEFIVRYIESTVKALPESYMLELAPKNAKNLEQLSMSYGEIIKITGGDNWMKVRENSKRQVTMLFNEITRFHNIPPCTMGFQFNSVNGFLDMNVFSRSIDLYYGLTNDIVVFFALQEIVARYNNLIPRKFMMSFGNLHFYQKNSSRVLDWIWHQLHTHCECRIFNKAVNDFS